MVLPLRPATIIIQRPGPNGSVDLCVLCADGRDCWVHVCGWQTTAQGIADAIERAVVDLELADSDARAALASFMAELVEPLVPLPEP